MLVLFSLVDSLEMASVVTYSLIRSHRHRYGGAEQASNNNGMFNYTVILKMIAVRSKAIASRQAPETRVTGTQ